MQEYSATKQTMLLTPLAQILELSQKQMFSHPKMGYYLAGRSGHDQQSTCDATLGFAARMYNFHGDSYHGARICTAIPSLEHLLDYICTFASYPIILISKMI